MIQPISTKVAGFKEVNRPPWPTDEELEIANNSVMNSATVPLFCYGTFKNLKTLFDAMGGAAAGVIEREPATLDNYRHDVGTDGYSYLRKDPSESVPGYLVHLSPQEVQKTDRREQRYKREWVTLKDGTKAWAYMIKLVDVGEM